MATSQWSKEDEQWFLAYLENTDAAELRELMRNLFTSDLETGVRIDPQASSLLWQHVTDRLDREEPFAGALSGPVAQAPVVAIHLRKNILRYAAVAALLVAGLLPAYLFVVRKGGGTPPRSAYRHLYKNDLPPGGNNALLTLANGTTIALNGAQNGMLTKQGSARVLKLDSGLLAYEISSPAATATMAPPAAAGVTYNILTTPRGGQYEIKLPDGTKVWLNAASSLRFPTAFTGGQRDVFLTGEAYFEVVHNGRMPFRVHAGNLSIEDIGTHFNVMAYPDEAAIRTTLLEGSVAVSDGLKKTLLKPGEQAVVDKTNPSLIKVQPADIEEVVAWKNGEFFFHHTCVAEVMRQVSRWYDVDISYQDPINGDYISGNIRRDVNISKVFEMLEIAGELRYNAEGKKITILK